MRARDFDTYSRLLTRGMMSHLTKIVLTEENKLNININYQQILKKISKKLEVS